MSVPIDHDSMVAEDSEEQFPNKAFWRTRGCLLLNDEKTSVCLSCAEHFTAINISKKKKENRLAKPAHIKAPISKTDPKRVQLTLQGHRLKCTQLEKELEEMRAELNKSHIEVDQTLMSPVYLNVA